MTVPAHPESIALVFPGVGVEWTGDERAFAARHAGVMRPFLRAAEDRVGAPLLDRWEGEGLPPFDPCASELLVFAFSCGMAEVCRRAGLAVSLAAGYSLGVYAAAVAAGAVRFADGLAMVQWAHAAVRAACRDREGGVGAVVGLEIDELRRLLAAHPPLCLININNDHSGIVAGPRAELSAFLGCARDRGALKADPLALDLPYHHPEALAGVPAAFAGFLHSFAWSAPAFPLLSSADASLLADGPSVRAYVARQLAEPFEWAGVVRALGRMGVAAAIECGPGISLAQNARFLPEAPRHVTVKTIFSRFGL